MADLLEIFATLLQFFAFVLLATAAVCVPVVIFLWSYEWLGTVKLVDRRSRRRAVPLTKIA